MTPRWLWPLLLFLFLAAALLSMGVGSAAIPLPRLLSAAFGNGDPVERAILLELRLPRTILALAVGAILLSRLQRSRVRTIGALAAERARLLDATMEIEERERRDLADNLHDGALQYVLAARQELATLRDSADPVTLDRVDGALRDAALQARVELL